MIVDEKSGLERNRVKRSGAKTLNGLHWFKCLQKFAFCIEYHTTYFTLSSVSLQSFFPRLLLSFFGQVIGRLGYGADSSGAIC